MEENINKVEEIEKLFMDQADFFGELSEKNEKNLFKGIRDPIVLRLVNIEDNQKILDKKINKLLKMCEISISENEKEALKQEYILKLKELGVDIK